MDFEEIENLEEEQLNEMYNEVVDFGDETHLAGCCCASGAGINEYSYRDGCTTWCRSLRSSCSSWATAFNYFRPYPTPFCFESC